MHLSGKNASVGEEGNRDMWLSCRISLTRRQLTLKTRGVRSQPAGGRSQTGGGGSVTRQYQFNT